MQKVNNSPTRGLKLKFLRQKLGMTQTAFGQKFGEFKGAQIGYAERTGQIPGDLLSKLVAAGHDISEIVREEASSSSLTNPDTQQLLNTLDELLRSNDQEIIEHIRRQASLLKELIDSRRQKKR